MNAASATPMHRRVVPVRHGSPQLTSLVDMMVILLVFLLKSFSVEGQLVTPAADLQLPHSSARGVVEPALSIEITTSGIHLAGQPVVDLVSVNGDSLLVTELYAELLGLAATVGPDGFPTRPVTIQCDRRVDFRILKRVLFTCNQAELENLSLLVMRDSS